MIENQCVDINCSKIVFKDILSVLWIDPKWLISAILRLIQSLIELGM